MQNQEWVSDLERYMNRAEAIKDNLRPQTLTCPDRPEVVEKEYKHVLSPSIYQDVKWGRADDLLDYIREQNRVPYAAHLEYTLHEEVLTVKWTWYEVSFRGEPDNRIR